MSKAILPSKFCVTTTVMTCILTLPVQFPVSHRPGRVTT
nr:MAG TPA: hypothetical protein [Caudoviricetes sp.]